MGIFYFIYYTIIFLFLPINQEDYKRAGGKFYPEVYLTPSDSLTWPINFEISIDVKDIKSLDISNESFFSKLVVSSYSKYDTIFKSNSEENISLKHEDFFAIEIKESSLNSRKISEPRYYFNNDTYNYLFYDDFYSKSVKLVQAPFDINWKLRDYPYDDQKLSFKFTTKVDTSIIKLNPSKTFGSKFSDEMDNLADGIYINSVSYNYKYNADESDIIQTSPTNFRPMVTETLEISLNISRVGSWLFLKLFFGGVLSFMISCLMFLLPITKDLESKFAIALGAIFGAVGNKYFIASELSGVQVFTKADLISNFIILMVVVNMLIMILQTSDKTFFDYLQKPKNALYLSTSIFVLGFIFISIV